MDKFKLLLKNPLLDNADYLSLKNDYLRSILDYDFCIPKIEHKSFIFSCFALSVDGQLSYADAKSGYNIARCNQYATLSEKNADLFLLILAITIADAIIIGTNSLRHEHGTFLPNITHAQLQKIRYKHNKSENLTAFVICRDLTNIDLADKLFSDDLHQVVICCLNNQVDMSRLPSTYAKLNLATWADKQCLKLKNIVLISTLAELFAKLHTIGFKVILNESPYFHHKLLQLKLLDEVWLNYSGSYIGGNLSSLGRGQNPFSSSNHPECELLTLHSMGYNFIYTRQKILY